MLAYNWVFNAERYHCKQAEEFGYITMEALQFVFGEEVIKVVSEASKGAKAAKAAANLDKGVQELAKGIKLGEEGVWVGKIIDEETKIVKEGTTALRKVGTILESVNDVMANPSLLQGQSYIYVRNILGKSEGWVNSVMTKTRATDKGWVLRQVNSSGQETGKLIQYHPGSRRHFGGAPYWKVSDGSNKFRFPAAK